MVTSQNWVGLLDTSYVRSSVFFYCLLQRARVKPSAMTATTKTFSLDEPTRAILSHVGNQSRYIQCVVQARDRVWRSALRALVDAGRTPKEIVAACEAAGPNVHTIEDWSRPPRDSDSLDIILDRARLACVVSEWWCGNERMRSELRSWAIEAPPLC